MVQLAIYGVIAWLSLLFDFYAAERERPLLLVVSLLLTNFALHLWSLAIFLKSPDSRNLGWRIVLIALALKQANAESVSGYFFGAAESDPALLVA